MASNKFWTVRNGKVGTAHLNRDGSEVDFRPGTVRADSRNFEVYPPKGIELPMLKIKEHVRAGEEKGERDRWTGFHAGEYYEYFRWRVFALYEAVYQGVKIRAQGEYLRMEDDRPPEIILAEKEENEKKATAQAAAARAEREKKEEKLETLSFNDLLEIGRKEKILRRIHSSIRGRRMGAIKRLKKSVGAGWRQNLLGQSDEELLARFLVHDEEVRAARKAAWLAPWFARK